jgi:protein-L-isoaspartate(D-aspartate) O-methyltransferase
VTAVEANAELAEAARAALSRAGAKSVAVEHGDLTEGFASSAPYDAILVNGALGARPETLLRQLKNGGRLVCVIGQGRGGRATLFVRSGDAWGERNLFDAAAPVLDAFQSKPGFVF